MAGDLTFNIDGLDLLGRKLARVGPLFVQEARALVAETVLYAEVAIQDKIDEYEAVDKGRLKGSIGGVMGEGVERDGPDYTFDPADSASKISAGNLGGIAQIEGVVGTNVSYAIPVHDGYTTSTGKEVDGRPFMEEALPEIAEQFEKRAHDRFGSLLDG